MLRSKGAGSMPERVAPVRGAAAVSVSVISIVGTGGGGDIEPTVVAEKTLTNPVVVPPVVSVAGGGKAIGPVGAGNFNLSTSRFALSETIDLTAYRLERFSTVTRYSGLTARGMAKEVVENGTSIFWLFWTLVRRRTGDRPPSERGTFLPPSTFTCIGTVHAINRPANPTVSARPTLLSFRAKFKPLSAAPAVTRTSLPEAISRVPG